MAEANPGADGKKQALQNFEAFLEAFDKCSEQLREATEAIRELTAAIWDEKNGLVSAIDDQLEALEIHTGTLDAHAKEMALLRAAITAGAKIDVDLGSLLSGGVRRRK